MPPREAGAARVTSPEPGLLARLSSAFRRPGPATAEPPGPKRLMSAEEFFGPGKPIAQAAPPGTPPRAFDYPTGVNLGMRPRPSEPISFEQLRALSENHDLTRIAIETRKGQVARQEWTLVRRDGTEADPPPAALEFLRKPDRELTWSRWVMQLVEEALVTDATSLYLRPTLGGQLYAVEQLDGATIVRKLDASGRTPAPPEVAFQQVIKGLPAVDFTRDELLYCRRNPRVHKAYGFSVVEQLVVTVNLALRRQAHQLGYYTKGNMPDRLISVPDAWTADQIAAFQKHWDSLSMAPDWVLERRNARFVPGGMKSEVVHTEPLFGEAEEWLARLVCWAFDLPPTALVKQNNRATAEQVADTAADEGLAPILLWLKEILDEVVQAPAPRGLGLAEWEFKWNQERAVKPKEQAEIDEIYVRAGIRTKKAVAIERFGEYEEVEEPEPDPADDENAPPARGQREAAKAAGRALRRRDPRWY